MDKKEDSWAFLSGNKTQGKFGKCAHPGAFSVLNSHTCSRVHGINYKYTHFGEDIYQINMIKCLGPYPNLESIKTASQKGIVLLVLKFASLQNSQAFNTF